MRTKSVASINQLAVLTLIFACGVVWAETPIFTDGFETLPITVIAVDPPLVQQASGVLAQAHVDNLASTPQLVLLHGPGGQEIESEFQFDPGFAGGFALLIPPGLAVGEWSLEVQPAGGGESSTMDSAFVVSDVISMVFESAPAALEASNGGVLQLRSEGAFSAIPQVLLRPSGADLSVVAKPLQGIELTSGSELSVRVPPNFTGGDHDLIVLNPDGTAGIAPAGLVLSDQAAPLITSVQPPAAYYGTSVDFKVLGSSFEVGSAAALICDNGNVVGLTTTFVSAIELELHYFGALAESTICIVEIQNSDGQVTAWSGVRMQGGSESFGAPALVSPMTQARRAPALAMARLSGTGHRVYAIGGDDGTDANALSTVEFMDVSAFGATGAWRPSAVELPAPRTFAWVAQHGHFLYLAGGFDGSDVVDTVYRAEILGSDSAPVISRYRLSSDPQATGFSSSTKAYRVAPVFPSDHPTNPSGVGTAGPVFVARVPAVGEISAALQWQAVPGAVAYQVFTQATGSYWDGNPGSLELLAVTASTSYVDAGDQATDANIRAHEAGETGQWHAIAGWGLAAPRSHAAGALSPLPGRPDDIALYLLGGLNDSGVALDSYTFTVITDAASAGPAYGSWTSGTESLTSAVYSAVAWPVSSSGGDSHWIFAGMGFSGPATPEKFIDRGMVAEDGDLGTFASMGNTPPSPGAAGATALTRIGTSLSNDGELAIAAGWAGEASDTLRYSALGAGPEPGNWNDLGYNLQQARIYAGSASGGPFIFTAGGNDGDGAALQSVERIVR